MRQIVVILVALLLGVGSAYAENMLYMSGSLGWGYCDAPSYLSADVKVGANMGDYVNMGGGVAAEFSVENNLLALPLFISVEGFLMGKGASPFVEFRMGYDLMRSAPYLQPSVGYRFPKKGVFKAIKPAIAYSWVNGSHDAVLLKVGVEF